MIARLFRLVRDTDVTGMSGVGVVAIGVEFGDGITVMHWSVEPSSTGIYATIEELLTIHGHHGATRIEYVDQDVPAA